MLLAQRPVGEARLSCPRPDCPSPPASAAHWCSSRGEITTQPSCTAGTRPSSWPRRSLPRADAAVAAVEAAALAGLPLERVVLGLVLGRDGLLPRDVQVAAPPVALGDQQAVDGRAGHHLAGQEVGGVARGVERRQVRALDLARRGSRRRSPELWKAIRSLPCQAARGPHCPNGVAETTVSSGLRAWSAATPTPQPVELAGRIALDQDVGLRDEIEQRFAGPPRSPDPG